MSSIRFRMLPAPAFLKNDVECLRIAHYSSEEAVTIKVAPSGIPGLVFQHDNGRPALEQIITSSGRKSCPTPFFLYGIGTEPSVMHYKRGSFTCIQVIFKPHALKTLFGINAARLSNGWAQLQEFGAGNLDAHLLDADNEQQCLALLFSFLSDRFKQVSTRDLLVEESLRFIHNNISSLSVKDLLQYFSISERQFERRFTQTVGISPRSYIRIKRFQTAIRLIKAGQFERLTDIAYALNFSDQSHFIRDIKAFSGMTPSNLSQRQDDFYHDQVGYSYL
jgi:AraC-like DNA-binding protein